MLQFIKKHLAIKKFFLLVVFCSPLYLVRLSIFGFPTNMFDLLMLAAILLPLSKTSFRNLRLPSPSIATASLLLIIIGLIISLLFGKNYHSELGILKSWFVLPIVFSFFVSRGIQSMSDLENVFKTIFYSCAFVGSLALMYKVTGHITYDGRLTAFYLSPNHLAMFLDPGIFFGLFLLNRQENKMTRNYYLLLLTIILAAVYFTYSYGAWLSLIVSILFVFSIKLDYKKKLLIFSCGLLFFSLLYLNQIHTQKLSGLFDNPSRSSIASRLMIWNASILMLKQHPFVGIGPGNFQESYLALQPYFPPYLEWAVPQPHNIFIAFWLQTGFLGLVGFLMLFFHSISNLYLNYKKQKNAFFLAPLLMFFVYFIFHGLIDTPFWKNDLAFYFWLYVYLAFTIVGNFYDKLSTPPTIVNSPNN